VIRVRARFRTPHQQIREDLREENHSSLPWLQMASPHEYR
jgi:hypothetical protein